MKKSLLCATVLALLASFVPAVTSADANTFAVYNDTVHVAKVTLYNDAAGKQLEAGTTLSAGAMAHWTLAGPRAIKVEVIHISIRSGTSDLCWAQEPVGNRAGEWHITYHSPGKCAVKRT